MPVEDGPTEEAPPNTEVYTNNEPTEMASDEEYPS